MIRGQRSAYLEGAPWPRQRGSQLNRNMLALLSLGQVRTFN